MFRPHCQQELPINNSVSVCYTSNPKGPKMDSKATIPTGIIAYITVARQPCHKKAQDKIFFKINFMLIKKLMCVRRYR